MTTATLEDVLVAANAKIVALAPETSGYLALAVANATSRLPLAMDDASILLGPEGTLTVAQRGAIVAPQEAARLQRERLGRLLGVSTGSMPGLAAAAKPRAEVDVDGLVASIEGALIPLNRGAAQRAIARLARQMAQLVESGRLPKVAPSAAPLGRRSVERGATATAQRTAPSPTTAPSAASSSRAAASSSPAALVAHAEPKPAYEPEPEPAHEPGPALTHEPERELTASTIEPSPSSLTDVEPRELTPTILGVGRVGFHAYAPVPASLTEPTPEEDDASATALDESCAVAPIEAMPTTSPSQALTVVPNGVEDVAPPPTRTQATAPTRAARRTPVSEPEQPLAQAPSVPATAPCRRRAGADLAPATQSDVDELLSTFGVAESRDPRRVAASLKALAGLELTAAPPVVWESPRPVHASAEESAHVAQPKAVEPEAADWASAPLPPVSAPDRRPRRGRLRVLTALLALGAVSLGVLWTVHPRLLDTLLDGLR